MTRFIAGALFAFIISPVCAQSAYPTKPIRVIMPIAGAVADVIMRAIGQELFTADRTALVVDNRTGTSGIIGAEACAKATPDGYTICAIYTATTSVNPHVFDKLPYDPARGFARLRISITSPACWWCRRRCRSIPSPNSKRSRL